jgi:hypothetical protein
MNKNQKIIFIIHYLNAFFLNNGDAISVFQIDKKLK